MKANRFSMTLYLSLPVLASACSVVMIAHFVLLVEGRIASQGPHGELFDYLALADSFDFFSGHLYSFRFLGPLISGSFARLFNFTGLESLGLLAGSLNFVYLLAGFGWMYALSLREKSINSFEIALPNFLVVLLPAFWQGIFLPVADALMFCFSSLILLGVVRQDLRITIPAILAGVMVSEWMLFTLFFLPLTDHIRGSVWKRGYFTVLPAIGLLLLLPLFTRIPDYHLFYRTADWAAMWLERFQGRNISFLAAFWKSFGLTIGFFAWRFYVVQWTRITASLTIFFAGLFAAAFLMHPDLAHRLIFPAMPALVFWQYSHKNIPDNPADTGKK